MQKECASCKIVKGRDDFYKDKRGTLGMRPSCKECEAVKRKEKQKVAQMQKHIQANKRGREDDNLKPDFEDHVDMAGGPKYQTEEAIKLSDYPHIEHDYPFFDFEKKIEVGKHYSMFYMASRNSGKTYLIKHLWPFFKTRFDIQIFFCNSFNAPIYREFLEGSDWLTCYDNYSASVIWDILDFQKQTKNALNLHVIMDDCSDEYNIKNSQALNQLFIRARNSAISIGFSSQAPTLLSKISRNNVDFLFMLKTRSADMKVTVMEKFLQGYVPYPETVNTKREREDYLSDWMKINTLDRNIIVVDYLNNGLIYRYRAPSE